MDDNMKYFFNEPIINIACFLSGSGTNYERIYERDKNKNYFVCSNTSNCAGVKKARANGHSTTVLDSKLHFIRTPDSGKIPRRGAERESYDIALCTLMEQEIGGSPDLICLAGYDLWISDWMVDKYHPRILNVHPGDTTRGYKGLGWIPSANALLAGENEVRSTVFFVDKGDDTGPVLVQSKPVPVSRTEWEKDICEIRDFASKTNAKNFKDFTVAAENENKNLLSKRLEAIARDLQNNLKVKGDWVIYSFAVHDLLAKNRVELEDRTVYIDGKPMPEYGYRMDEYDS
jgi:folate-dependent phosphoribosylglycinamide formyltransferase PurN